MMCDIQDCEKPCSFELGESDSEEFTRSKGYQIKKLCRSHNFMLMKKASKKKKENYCVDPWETHLVKCKSNCTVKGKYYEDILALPCPGFKPVSSGDHLCKHCQDKFNNLILENNVKEEEEESSLEITSQASSHSGLTQDENLTKLNKLLDSYNVKTVKKNPSVPAIEKAMQELKNKVFDSLDNQVSALEGLNLVMI